MSGSARSYKATAFVLRVRNLGEADKVVTLLTDAFGKVAAVGKGVRRAKSHLSGRLEFMNEIAVMMHRGRNLDVIVNAEIVRTHWTSVVDPQTFGTLHVMAELIDAFVEPDLAVPDVFDLLRGAARAAARVDDPSTLVPRFQMRLLDALGIGIHASACVLCSKELSGEPAFAHLEAGGLACAACRPYEADRMELSAAEVANLQSLAAPNGGKARAGHRAMPAVARAVEAFTTHHLGRRTKSGRYLDELAG